MNMSDNNFFCIFCPSKLFFKNELREHIRRHHQKNIIEISGQTNPKNENFDQLVRHLTNYCSELEKTIAKIKKRRKSQLKSCDKRHLPEDNVSELLVGCRLCDQIISHYKLETFNRTDKPSKEWCICGNSNDDDNGLTLVTCVQCRHSFHFECFESEDYSGQNLSEYMCKYCKTLSFPINTCNDMKPLDQIIHYKQHINYRPYKCCFDQSCGQTFFVYPMIVEHLKNDHQMTDQSISESYIKKKKLYSYQKIIEIEELYQGKGFNKELTLTNPISLVKTESKEMSYTLKSIAIKYYNNKMEKLIEIIKNFVNTFDENILNVKLDANQIKLFVDTLTKNIEQPLIDTLECKHQIGLREGCSDIDKYKDLFIENTLKPLLPKHLRLAQNIMSPQTCITLISVSPQNSVLSEAQVSVNPISAEPVVVPTPSTSTQTPKKTDLKEVSLSIPLPVAPVLSSYSIPHNKLPNNLSEILIKDIDDLIKLSDKNPKLLDESLNKDFDILFFKIEKQCRKLTPLQSNEIHLYISSNVRHIKDKFAEIVYKTQCKVLQQEVDSVLFNLRKSIAEIKDSVIENYDILFTEFNDKKKKGEPLNSLPLKQIPFNDEITNHFNKAIELKVEYFDIISTKEANLNFRIYFTDFLNELTDNWPENWRPKSERLLKRAKLIKWFNIKWNKNQSPLKTNAKSPQKTNHNINNNNSIEKSFNNICLETQTLINGISTTGEDIIDPISNSTTITSDCASNNLSVCQPIDSNTSNGVSNTSVADNQMESNPIENMSTKRKSIDIRIPVLSHQNDNKCEEPPKKRQRSEDLEPQINLSQQNEIQSTPQVIKQNVSSVAKEYDSIDRTISADLTFRAETEQNMSQNKSSVSPVVDEMVSQPIASTSSQPQISSTNNEINSSKRNHLKQSDNSKNSDVSPSDENLRNFNAWMGMTKIVKFPYFPQIEDKVVYIRAGHYNYLKALRDKDLINSTRNEFKTHIYSEKEFEDFDVIHAIVKQMSFEFKRIPLIVLKLEEVDPHNQQLMQKYFEVKYIKLDEVPDFIILEQNYEKSKFDQSWKVGDSFKRAIADGNNWISGSIIDLQTFNSKRFPHSDYKKFIINYEDNSRDELSPWDLEPFSCGSESKEYGYPNLSSNNMAVIQFTDRLSFYEPSEEDWPYTSGDILATYKRDCKCAHLSKGFNWMLGTVICLPFKTASLLYPNPKPIYKIDLITISKRIESCFYRRSAQILFDLEAIEHNLQSYKDSEKVLNIYRKILKIFKRCIESDIWDDSQDIELFFLEEFPDGDIIDNSDIIEVSDMESNIDSTEVEITKSEEQNERKQSEESLKTSEALESPPVSTSHSICETEVDSNIEENVNKTLEKSEAQAEMASNLNEDLDNPPKKIETTVTISTESDSKPQIEIKCEPPEPVPNANQMYCEVGVNTSTLIKTEFQNKYYLCVFCKTDTKYSDRNQVLDHYRRHLGNFIQCSSCSLSYNTVEDFRSLHSIHLENKENNLRIKQFYLTLDWINTFLDFQMTDNFNKLFRRDYCPVCSAIQIDDQTLIALNSRDNDSFEEHIRKHLKYNQIYECLKCKDESNGEKYKFYFDLNDVKTHLQTHYPTNDLSDQQINDSFLLCETQNKILSKNFIQPFIDLNKRIEDIYENIYIYP